MKESVVDQKNPDLAPNIQPDSPISYVQQDSAPQWLAGMNAIPEVTQYKETSYQLLQLQPGMIVLDLGCGIGDDAAQLAPFVCPGGWVIGIDTDHRMITQAQARYLSVPLDDPALPLGQQAPVVSGGLDFQVGPAEKIPLANGSCDAVRVDRVLQHVSDVSIVLHEIQRVLRPNGILVAVEPDWRTIAIHPGSPTGSDDHVLEAILQWHLTHTRTPLIGRQLRARLRQAGFSQINVMPVAYSSTSFTLMSYVLELATAGEAAVQESPAKINQTELTQWFATAEHAEKDGEFFAAVMLYFAVARKKP